MSLERVQAVMFSLLTLLRVGEGLVIKKYTRFVKRILIEQILPKAGRGFTAPSICMHKYSLMFFAAGTLHGTVVGFSCVQTQTNQTFCSALIKQ